MRAAQADVLSPAIVKLQPLMIAAAQAGGSVDNAVLDQLTTWDATMRADRPEPLIFTAWMREAVRAIYRDDLGAAFDRYFDTRATALIRLLEGQATGRDWCDDRTTPERERCGAMLAAALNRALGDLEVRYGNDRSQVALGRGALCFWRASAVRHRGLARAHTSTSRCRARAATTRSIAARWISTRIRRSPTATRRAIAPSTTSPTWNVRSTSTRTGQSGNPLSPYYRSFAERWAKVDYIEIATKREEIAKAPLGTWKLTPK